MSDKKVQETEEIKHSIISYLAISGGPTADLGAISLKLIDVIDDILTNKSPCTELDMMAELVVKTMAQVVKERMDQMSAQFPALGDDISTYTAALAGADGALRRSFIERKYMYLGAIANAFRAMEKVSGCQYPVVRDLEGNVI